jgi:hypothetical protein
VALTLILLGAVVACLFWNISSLPGGYSWRAAQDLQRQRVKLRTAPTSELLALVRGAVQHRRWQRFPSVERMMVIEDPAALRDALNALVAEMKGEDRQKNQFGRDTMFYEFCNSPLALVLEVLESRCASS